MRHGTLIKAVTVIALGVTIGGTILASYADKVSQGAVNVRRAMKAGDDYEAEQIRRLFLKMLGEKCLESGKTVNERQTCI